MPKTPTPLEQILSKADDAYAAGQPFLADDVYDVLRDRVATEKVGAAPGTIVHDWRPMLSLAKCTEPSAFAGWAGNYAQHPMVVQYKVDGVACSLRYDENGTFVRAATRGDGAAGEDITEHVRHLAMPLPPGSPMEIRGELYMPRGVFLSNYAQDFSNPRNLVAGILGTKVLDERRFDVRLFVYDAFNRDRPFHSLSHALEWAMEQGFDTDYWTVSAREVSGIFDHALARLGEQDFEADGIVVSVDQRDVFENAGSTSHHPRAAIAWKFPPEQKPSHLVDVLWQTARTGRITPVAVVEPVLLSGATVTKATLHNAERFKQLKPSIGATVEMVRRGGVIPHVEAIKDDGHEPLELPEDCPRCGAPVEYVAPDLLCTSDACGAQKLRQLAHFASLAGFDGWGPSVVADLSEAGLLTNFRDFWKVHESADLWEMLPGYGIASVQKLLEAVPKTLPLQTYIAALGVPGVGPTTAWNLCQRFTHAELIEASLTRLMVIPSIGLGTAQTIMANLIPLLRDPPCPLTDHSEPVGPMKGMVVVFTGELESMKRLPAQRRVVALGGEVGSGVTKKTTMLVHGGSEQSNKFRAAQEKGIRVVNENDFLREFPQFLTGAK